MTRNSCEINKSSRFLIPQNNKSLKNKGMSSKLTLNIAAMQEDFFSDAALIGIVSGLPAYYFCWMLNQHFDMSFTREPELDIRVLSKTNHENFFPIYQYCVPLNGARYLLYKLKSNKQSLLPEAKNLDYLWMIQSSTPAVHAKQITDYLRDMPEVQLAQIIEPEKLKNLGNLLV